MTQSIVAGKRYLAGNGTGSPTAGWARCSDDAFGAAVRLGKPRQDVLRCARISLELRVAQFTHALNPGKPVRIVVDGKTWQEEGNGTRRYVDVYQWLKAYRLALILRARDARNLLMQVPDEILMQECLGDHDFFLHQVQFIKSLYSPDMNHQHYFQQMMQTVLDMEIRPERQGILNKILIPTLELFGAALSGNPGEYQEAMLMAVKDHQAWFTKDGDAMRNSGGWCSTRLTAMAAFAWDHREYEPLYPEPIFQEYIPEWLVKGEFESV